jgi:hypothetical protein
MHCVKDGEVIIKHDNSNILKTYTSGVEIIGALYATSVDLNDNQKILLGTGDDLEIYHDGSNSYLKNNTGILKITGVSGQKIDFMDGSAYYARFNSGSQVDLFHNNSVKFSTKDYGVSVNGNIRLTTGGDGYTFISDSDTGMHNPFNGGLNFKVNGSDRLTINNVGIATFSNVNVEIKQDLDVDGHTNLDNVSIAGVVTATSYYGDGSNLSNVISGVDLKFEGASVGTGVTMLNFVGFNTVTPPASGLSTITSGQNLTIGVRSGSAVEASLTGTSFNVIARSGGNISINI